jgi:N-acetylglucosaminyldiphosphoundecaprenol N-acetyl-beta-D-mannosaminyltransferase
MFALNRERPFGSFLGEAERVTFVGALVRRGMTPTQAVTFLLAWHLYLCAVALLLTVAIRQSWLLKLAILVGLGAIGVAGFAVTFQIVYGWRMVRGEAGLKGIRILGTFVHRTTLEDALEHVFLWARQDRLHHVVTADATLVDRASREPELAAIIDQASLVTPDGAGVLFAARLLGAPFPERVAGVDLTRAICQAAAERQVPVYLLGAQPVVVAAAAERLRAANPGLELAGVRDGYFTPAEEPGIVREIAESGARILLVGLGVPHQERFIHRNRAALGVGVVMGIGGTFDVISGRVARAPMWMQSAGLEWLWRVARDPRRLPRLIALPRFFWRVAAHTIRTRGLGRTTG